MTTSRVLSAAGLLLLCAFRMEASTCTTQAVMPEATRSSIASTATELNGYLVANASDKVRARTVPQFATDQFGGIQSSISNTAPHLQASPLVVQSVWLLDATDLKTASDAQFYCSLQKSNSSVTMTIPALPPGRWAVAISQNAGVAPWQVTVLFQELAGRWMLAGFFPRALTAAGHDGLWFWTSARGYASNKQSVNAYIFYAQAHSLLQPAPFIATSHLDRLEDEMQKATPPAFAQGVTSSEPLALKAEGGDILVTSLEADDSLGNNTLDVAIHIRATAVADAAAARARNRAAALALAKAYPELKSAFHGVWVYADVEGAPVFPSEEAFATLQ